MILTRVFMEGRFEGPETVESRCCASADKRQPVHCIFCSSSNIELEGDPLVLQNQGIG